MSYCRFGDTSDVLAFQVDEDVFGVVVANKRIPSIPPEEEDRMSVEEYQAYCDSKSVSIGGRFDGQTFRRSSPRELFELLRDLATVGYMVDPSTWRELNRFHPELRLDEHGVCPKRKIRAASPV